MISDVTFDELNMLIGEVLPERTVLSGIGSLADTVDSVVHADADTVDDAADAAADVVDDTADAAAHAVDVVDADADSASGVSL